MNRLRQRPARTARALLALTLGGWLATLGILAVGPHLHGFLHQHPECASTTCLACSLNHGLCAAPDTLVLAVTPPAPAPAAKPPPADLPPGGADHLTPPGRAPPRHLPLA